MHVKLIATICISSLTLISVGLSKFINTSKNSSSISKSSYLFSELTRVQIFKNKEIFTSLLNPLLGYIYENGVIKQSINEEELFNTLRPFIREELAKLAAFKGWVFNNLTGRIYYEINGSKLEVYVVWKGHPYSANYSFFDRFTIAI